MWDSISSAMKAERTAMKSHPLQWERGWEYICGGIVLVTSSARSHNLARPTLVAFTSMLMNSMMVMPWLGPPSSAAFLLSSPMMDLCKESGIEMERKPFWKYESGKEEKGINEFEKRGGDKMTGRSKNCCHEKGINFCEKDARKKHPFYSTCAKCLSIKTRWNVEKSLSTTERLQIDFQPILC